MTTARVGMHQFGRATFMQKCKQDSHRYKAKAFQHPLVPLIYNFRNNFLSDLTFHRQGPIIISNQVR
jgi:hypothetical protein